MEGQTPRWVDRLDSYGKALSRFEDFASRQNVNDMEEAGLVKAFEFTFELAWKTLKDLFLDEKYENVGGPRSVLRQALKDGWIEEATAWEGMLDDRNLAVHIYGEEFAQNLIGRVRNRYLPLISALHKDLKAHARSLYGG